MTSRNSISCQADLNEIETEYDNEYEKFEEYNLSSPHSKNPLQFSLIASEEKIPIKTSKFKQEMANKKK